LVLVSENINEFLEQWATHETGLKAKFELKHERFIFIAVNQDEQSATDVLLMPQYVLYKS